MDDRTLLDKVFDGMQRVLSVHNWVTSGAEGEVRQGKMVADVARSVGVEHLVDGSAGTGESDTGLAHFNSKLEGKAYMRTLDLPFTIVRPAPFMELLTEKEFFPAMGAWGVKPKVLGGDTPIPWVAVRDIGIAVSNNFEDPKTWIGRDVSLYGDVKTFGESRAIFTTIDGKKPL
jgi:uncharacterized protein YbjT (DUF2867 family)